MAELSPERIAATALAVLDEHGMEGFGMRAVARALDVTPMALYHHVRNKAELASLVVKVANEQFPLPERTGDWREDMWLMAKSTREQMLAHPAVIELRRQYRIWTADILKKSDYWVALWHQTGLPPEQASLAAVTSSRAILGMVSEEPILRREAVPHHDLLQAQPNAGKLFRLDIDQDAVFELAVKGVIDGIYQRVASG